MKYYLVVHNQWNHHMIQKSMDTKGKKHPSKLQYIIRGVVLNTYHSLGYFHTVEFCGVFSAVKKKHIKTATVCVFTMNCRSFTILCVFYK